MNQAHDILLILAPPVWVPEAPPMGLAYLYEHLSAQGYKAEVLDLNERVYNRDGELQRFWEMDHAAGLTTTEGAAPIFEAFRPLLESLLQEYLESPPVAVGFCTYHLNTPMSVHLARFFKEKCGEKTRIIFGGPSMLETDERRKLPEELVDYIVLGEAEKRLGQLLAAIKDDRRPELPGLLTAADYRQKTSRAESFVVDEQTPDRFPRYGGFNLDAYSSDYLPLLMARGCPFHCAFCNDQFSPYRRRSTQAVLDEIRHHVFVNGIRRFFFCDQTLDADPKRLEALCDGIISGGLNIEWWGQLNIKRQVTRPLLEKMRRAGCNHLSWGVETLSDAVLKRIHKPSTADLAVQVLKLTHEVGIPQLVYLIVGLPGETDQTFKESMARLRLIAPYVDHVSIMPSQVSPFSPMDEDPGAYGIVMSGEDPKNQWQSIDGQNTYQKRMVWLTALIETLLELKVSFQSPILNRPRYAELLGRELPEQ